MSVLVLYTTQDSCFRWHHWNFPPILLACPHPKPLSLHLAFQFSLSLGLTDPKPNSWFPWNLSLHSSPYFSKWQLFATKTLVPLFFLMPHSQSHHIPYYHPGPSTITSHLDYFSSFPVGLQAFYLQSLLCTVMGMALLKCESDYEPSYFLAQSPLVSPHFPKLKSKLFCHPLFELILCQALIVPLPSVSTCLTVVPWARPSHPCLSLWLAAFLASITFLPDTHLTLYLLSHFCFTCSEGSSLTTF